MSGGLLVRTFLRGTFSLNLCLIAKPRHAPGQTRRIFSHVIHMLPHVRRRILLSEHKSLIAKLFSTARQSRSPGSLSIPTAGLDHGSHVDRERSTPEPKAPSTNPVFAMWSRQEVLTLARGMVEGLSYAQIAEKLPRRSAHACRTRAGKSDLHPLKTDPPRIQRLRLEKLSAFKPALRGCRDNRAWTEEEEHHVLELWKKSVSIHQIGQEIGRSMLAARKRLYESIAEKFPGRTEAAVKSHVYLLRKRDPDLGAPKLWKHWSSGDSHHALKSHIRGVPYRVIAKNMKGRTYHAVRNHLYWLRKQDPNLGVREARKAWSPEETRYALDFWKKGHTYRQIADGLPGRTRIAVKSYVYDLRRKQSTARSGPENATSSFEDKPR